MKKINFLSTIVLGLSSSFLMAQEQNTPPVASGDKSAPTMTAPKTTKLISRIESAEHGETLLLANEWLSLKISVADSVVIGGEFTDKVNGITYTIKPDLFRLGFATGEKNQEGEEKLNFTSSADFLADQFSITPLPAEPKARRLVERREGVSACLTFATPDNGVTPAWFAELREGSPYIRLFVTITCRHAGQPIREIRIIEFKAASLAVHGSVKGSPITASGEKLFLGTESPLGNNFIEDGKVVCAYNTKIDLPGKSTTSCGAIMGVCTPTQLRRTFQLAYINEERARPFGIYLNYNTWYDLGFFNRYSEAEAIETVTAFDKELRQKRGVNLDSMLMDDGWDDEKTLWKFHKGWPNEFKTLKTAMAKAGTEPGVWFSPWGGYGQPKDNRLAAAKGTGLETQDGDNVKFTLTNPKYFEHFKNMCFQMIRNNGVNHFKFDGTSTEEHFSKGQKYTSDFHAIIGLIGELRKERPDIYINLTTGTWPSPFWFAIVDSIWRGGYDHEFVGVGSPRNQWMTFRDAMIYQNNVLKSPLFPINSLMTHGVIYAEKARDLNTDPGNELANEIWSGFAFGTQMQEIYISPKLMSQKNWDDLAAAAKWARKNQNTLVDTHWIGGNPTMLEVYGWASWSPEQGIIGLRNPSNITKTYTFDVGAIFELPLGASATYSVSSPKGDKFEFDTLKAGQPATITLKPFEVIVIDAKPQ
ncbi:MAG: enterotoxin [Akkermansia sp.]